MGELQAGGPAAARCGRPPRESHPPALPEIERPPAKVFAVLRGIERARLPANAKLVLQILVRQVDWRDWIWPKPITDTTRGLSMSELGRRCGWAGRKTPQRVMRVLIEAGLVERVERQGYTNAFRVFPDAILALGEEGAAERRAYLDEADTDGRTRKRPGRDPRQVAEAEPPTPAPAPAPPPPWAVRAAGHHTIPARVFEVQVRRVLAAVAGGGQTLDRTGEGARAARVIQAWTADTAPELVAWTDGLVADIAALHACEEPLAATWRRKVAHDDWRWLTRESYPRLRKLAAAHRAGLHYGCGGHPADVEPRTPMLVAEPADVQDWRRRGRVVVAREGPWSTRTWGQALAEIRRRLPPSEVETWFEGLVLLHQGERVELGVPNAYHATWLAEHHGALLSELLGAWALVLRPT